MSRGIYENGLFTVEVLSGDEISASDPPPKPLLIAIPTHAGNYPVVIFLHGMNMSTSFYSQLMAHVASHGYVVVAPQMYSFTLDPDSCTEITDAAKVVNWLPENLQSAIQRKHPAVMPNLNKLVLAGHSRGGKVAFGLALGLLSTKTTLKFSALVALDPVDGPNENWQTKPHIVNDYDHSVRLQFPTLILGTGLGCVSAFPMCPPCAPCRFGHKNFYRCSTAPIVYHVVASEYGHMDFLDDKTDGFLGNVSYVMCKNGPCRAGLRTFAGGLLVAFFKAALFGNTGPLDDIVKNWTNVPIKLEKPEWYRAPTEAPMSRL